ncbi:MAG TPA: hypothetical protein VEF06_12155 [Bryobacteraceae bacterium]|nr:hypothetical protein [Bryobacteraceae bacterium]
MLRKIHLGMALLTAALVAAESAPPAWTTRRVAEWSMDDARQVLYQSPWAKRAAPALLGQLTGAQRRDGGNFAAQGGGHGGVGLDDFSLVGNKGAPAPRRGEGPEGPHVAKVTIRWESALPVRAAEVRANEPNAPVLEGDEYAIAVYDVSLTDAWADRKHLAEELKKIAVLKIEGRKEARPSRVAVQEFGDGRVTVIYLFPRSLNITLDDKRLTFEAQIGRVAVAQYFYPAEMQYQGKLEL